ncbi:hypothetical protein DCAR_0311740 [Daucus carota subsp. sativus]|uniref:Endonuclease/exonuclease/phosphatase domain-containing protein n=1 Tax=Daucus carota subsp. sativus TaxID=79200 RepID=A0AAF0WPR9_DAUCS|nr:hypothetical protein DCAR_0311740 [Daucus carota subsp. sativus]
MPYPFGWIESPSTGLSGGLLTLWNKSIFSISFSKVATNWLLIRGSCLADGRYILIINFYAPQPLASKKHIWAELLHELGEATETFIIMMGDFNAVHKVEERVNSVFCVHESSAFNDFIEDTGLIDVHLVNSMFTWFGPANKCSRLDRILVSHDWLSLGNWSLTAQDRVSSDHRPIVLTINQLDWGPKPFKLFNCWLEDPHFVETLRNSWLNCRLNGFTQKFRRLREVAKKWGNQEFGSIDEKIKALLTKQDKADAGLEHSLDGKQIKVELDRLIQVKVGVLCQKSRLNWELKGKKTQNFFTGP